MLISRRSSLRILIGAGAALKNLSAGPALFEVDRLAGACPRRSSPSARVWQRRYRASATVTLLSIPVFSRAGVGTGFTIIEEGAAGDTNTVTIQFGAGSWPGRQPTGSTGSAISGKSSPAIRAGALQNAPTWRS